MERIEVKKVYVGSAVKFGLLYGLIVGFLVTIVMLVLLLMSIINVGDVVGPASFIFSLFGSASLVYLLVFTFFFYIIMVFIVMLIASLLYNLSSKLGGRLHLGLAEYIAPVKPVKSVQNKPNVKLGTSARTNKKSGNKT